MPSDEQVMASIQGGHLEMLGILFERYHARVHGLCTQMVQDVSLADDLVQEAFVRVLRYRDSFSTPGSFGAWLHRIVRNVCLDDLKARGREAEALERLRWMETRSPPGRRWSAGECDRVERLRDAFAKLAEDERDLLILKRVHGLPYREIAERCGSTEGALRVRAHRALQRLRDLMKVRTEGEGDDV